MKNKLLSLILGFTLILTGCGVTSTDKSYNEEAYMQNSTAASDETVSEEPGVTSDSAPKSGMLNNKSNPQSNTQRKLVKNSSMNLETKEFDEGMTYLLNLIEENGGYIQSQNTNGNSLYNKNDRFCRSATIIARIPSENLETTQNKISDKFNITYKNDFIDDITDSYYDTEAHLNTLKAQEKKLLELLDKAEELSDVIELEKALAQCRGDIDAFTGRLKRMDNQVAFSTITINLAEVIEYQDSYNAPLTFGEKIKRSFSVSGRHLQNFFSGMLFFIIEDLPLLLIQLVIFGAIILLVVWIIKKIRKSFAGKAPKTYGSAPVNYAEQFKKEVKDNKDIKENTKDKKE